MIFSTMIQKNSFYEPTISKSKLVAMIVLKKTAPSILKLHPPAKFQVCSPYQFRNNLSTDKKTHCDLIYKLIIKHHST